MNKRRLICIAFLFAALVGVALYFLLDRMVFNRDGNSLARYTDKKFIAVMEKLIQENVFKIEGTEIVIDDNGLSRQGLSKKTTERVRKNIAHLYAKDGKIRFDGQSTSIANLRDTGNVTILRGKFLDRNGVTLAQSVLDEKTRTVTRKYLQGPECYPLTGHDSKVYGKRNLEKHLDGYLDGSSLTPLYRPANDPFRKVKIGDDVQLTIDSRVQKAAYHMLKGIKGAVVVLDVKTGEILASVSAPSFDPNTQSTDAWRRAFADGAEKPYENRAFSSLYPPGSTFKTVVASALLENDLQEREGNPEQIFCNGKKNRFNISDIHAHGKVGFSSAFVVSCNHFFSEAGVSLGPELQSAAERFGFNRKIDLLPQMKGLHYAAETSLAFSRREPRKSKPSATDGEILNGLEKYREIDFRRNPKVVAQGAIGQNLTTATPLQMAMVAAAVANNGMVMNPFLVKKISDGRGKALFEGKPVKLTQAIQARTAKKMSLLMEQVMQNGTGKNVKKLYLEGQAKSREIRIAGKTGTAEIGDRNGNGVIDPDEKPHSWFIGFAPADAPRIAIAVVAENQGLGSLTAAPIAVDVLAEALTKIAEKNR